MKTAFILSYKGNIITLSLCEWDFPGGTSGKEPACQCRSCKDAGSIPGLGRSPGGGHGDSLQYSFLENSMGREAWWAIVQRIPKNRTRLKQLSIHVCRGIHCVVHCVEESVVSMNVSLHLKYARNKIIPQLLIFSYHLFFFLFSFLSV